jgi:LacI family transcriptional regulator
VLDSMLGRRTDAIITTASRLGDERVLRQVSEQVPLVLAVRDLPGSGLVSITHDDERGGRLAAEHLVETGHRRIAQLRGPDDVSSFRGRGRGFAGHLAGTDVELVEPSQSAQRPVLAEGRRVMDLLLDEVGDDVPTAVFAHNDLMAFGALQALGQRGLSCPADVAVVGYNDTIMTEFTDPPITTVRLPGYELGRMAAETAVALIDEGHRPDPPLSLPPVLVPRHSTLGWTPGA